MSALRSCVLSLLLTAATLTGSVSACGFEDPSSIGFKRGVLNLAFPKSLYVTSAVWHAQQAGLIAKDAGSSAGRGSLGYYKALSGLKRLGQALSEANPDARIRAFSVVLVGPVLWARFEPEAGALAVRPHIDGPGRGDVVIVTDTPVIMALADGRLDFSTAQATGLVRLYGQPDAVAELVPALVRTNVGAGEDRTFMRSAP